MWAGSLGTPVARSPQTHFGATTALAYGPTGQLAVGHHDRAVRIVAGDSLKEIWAATVHEAAINAVAWFVELDMLYVFLISPVFFFCSRLVRSLHTAAIYFVLLLLLHFFVVFIFVVVENPFAS